MLDRWEEGSPYMAAAAVTLIVLLIGVSVSRLIYPYDVGYYEACIWEPARLAIEGRNPYEYSMTAPFIMAPYGYVYYLVVGLGLKLFGMQLWFGRLLSVVATSVCIVCVWRISFSLTGMRRAASFAVIVALASAVLQSWVAVQRPDLIALSLAFAGLTLVFESGDEADRIGFRTLLMAILFALAFFTKQTVVFPAFVASARYLQLDKKRNAWFVLLATIALATFTIFVLNWGDQKGHWEQHYILAAGIPHSYHAAVQMSAHWLTSPHLWGAIFILSLLFVKNLVPRAEGSVLSTAGRMNLYPLNPVQLLKSPEILVFSYFISALALAFVTSARRGANINYYLESVFVLSIVSAISLRWLSEDQALGKYLLPLTLLFVLGGLIQSLRIVRGEYFRWQSLPYYKEIVFRLNQSTSPESVSISIYPELVVAAGRKYHFGDWIQYVDGRSDRLEQVFQSAVESDRYAAIIWFDKNAINNMPGYELVTTTHPPPERYYPAYLFIRGRSASR